MKIAVKSTLAGAAIAVAATFGAPMAHAAVSDTDEQRGPAHSGSYGSQSAQREVAKFEPTIKTSGDWGPSQFGSATSAGGWAP